MIHEQNLPDISEPEDAFDAVTDSRTRDHSDVMEAPSGKMVNPSTRKHVGRTVNPVEKLGYTSLHDAARDNAYAAAAILLENDADVNARDEYGYPPLHWAAWHNAYEAAAVLLENGADVNAKNDKDFTSLHWAAWNNGHETATILLENGADVNAKSEEGDTPLHWAAWRNVYEAEGISLEDQTGSIRETNPVIHSCTGEHGVMPIKQRSYYWRMARISTRKIKMGVPDYTSRRKTIRLK